MAPLWARPIGPGQLQFSEVCQKVPNLVHLGDAPAPSESMLQVLRGTGTSREGIGSLPAFLLEEVSALQTSVDRL